MRAEDEREIDALARKRIRAEGENGGGWLFSLVIGALVWSAIAILGLQFFRWGLT